MIAKLIFWALLILGIMALAGIIDGSFTPTNNMLWKGGSKLMSSLTAFKFSNSQSLSILTNQSNSSGGA